MRNTAIKTFVIAISFVILVGLACGTSDGADPTATSEVIEEPVEPTPTNTSEPVVMPSPTTAQQPTNTTAPPTEEVEDEPPAYFVEEFEGDLSSWSYFVMHGDENKMDLLAENGKLVFDLQGKDLYVYVLYKEYTYSQVRIDVMAENRGANNNSVSLVCNYTDTYGWYEFNISNNGMYEVLCYSEIDGGYQYPLATGGSTEINMGRDTNVYTAICEGNHLALYINGYLENELTDSKYNLPDGQVGFSVSSFNVVPVRVEVDYFAISQP